MNLPTNPEFYDIFGIFVFSFIIAISSWMLYTKKKPQKWMIVVLLIIGILGLIVDSAIIYLNFFR